MEQGAFYTRAGGVRSCSSPEHILGRAALAGEQTATSFWRNPGAPLKNVSARTVWLDHTDRTQCAPSEARSPAPSLPLSD